MDVFKIDQSLNRLGTAPTDASKVTTEVSFDTSTDFGLSFFDPSTPPPTTPAIKKEEYDDRSNCVFDPIFSPSPVTPESNSYASDKGDYSHFDTLSGYGNETNSAGSSAANSPQSSASGTPVVHRSSSMPALLPPASSIYDKSGGTPGSTSPGLLAASQKAIKSEPGFAAADSNLNSNSPSTKSFVPCKVCGDKASGYHYGVTSCEGCKGFFRRSIQKQIEYRCLRDGKCLVIRLNRNRCQYCRFKKCLAVGMSRDSVRYGRVPKRNRERNEEIRASQNEPEQPSKEVDTKHLALYDVILTISQAHLANCAYTEEKTRGLLRKPLIISYSDGSQDNPEAATSTMESIEHQKLLIWEHLAAHMTPSIQRIVEFAKRVPGFSDLTQDDQLILIKVGFFEIWLAHIAGMISTVDNTVTFAEGVYVTRSQLETCFDSDFVSTLFDFAVTFSSLNLNDTEMGLFSAIILLTADRPNLGDQKKIEQQQDKLIEALKVQVERGHVTESHIYPSLIMKLAELRNLGSKHGEHLAWFRIKWQHVKLPPLFAEIFDIPKCEEDLQ